jgi:hypothetical protein
MTGFVPLATTSCFRQQALCCALVLVLVVVFIVILVIYGWVSAALRQTLTRVSVANMSEDKR